MHKLHGRISAMAFCRVMCFAVGLLMATISGLLHADWADSSDPLDVRVFPSNGSRVLQNPPGFTWSRSPGAAGYEIELRNLSQKIPPTVWQSQTNWYLPATVLNRGRYAWRVRPAGTEKWSDLRQFDIDVEAEVFKVPSNEELLGTVRATARPRSVPERLRGVGVAMEQVDGQTAATFSRLARAVEKSSSAPLLSDTVLKIPSRLVSESQWASALSNVQHHVNNETGRLRTAAAAWLLSKDDRYLSEALRRGDALAALSLEGATSHSSQDQANRAIAWALAVAYDQLHRVLDGGRRAAWRASIRNRTLAIYADLGKSGWRLEQRPLDSHGATNLGYLAAISALMIGEIEDAEEWFRKSFRFYMHYQSPWGDESGGYANGSAYAQYSAYYFLDFWDALAAATGVSLYEKPWAKGLMRFLVCFVPPGSKSHVFGDGSERGPDFSVLRAFATRFSDPVATWYANQLSFEEDALTRALGIIPRAAADQHPPKSCAFPGIGWSAFHSGWERGRTSLYFKSSRYGAFNHSHGDQNAFVLFVDGQAVLGNAGIYDWYGSPQWRDWYRSTAAHNAVTYDGGKGQRTGDSDSVAARAQGKITKFDANMVTGSAAAAYASDITQADRTIWYLRGANVFVVHDRMRGTQPRRMEWNFHVPVRIETLGPSRYVAHAVGTAVCLTTVYPSDTKLETFPSPGSVTSKEPGAMRMSGRVSTSEALTSQEFVHVVDPGCKNARLEFDLAQRTLLVGNESVRLDR